MHIPIEHFSCAVLYANAFWDCFRRNNGIIIAPKEIFAIKLVEVLANARINATDFINRLRDGRASHWVHLMHKSTDPHRPHQDGS